MTAERKQQRAQAKADLKVVESVLRRWDPIGVFSDQAAEEWPRDEYDMYAPPLLSLLLAGGGVADLERKLGDIRTGAMGLQPDPVQDSKIARELVDWWHSRTQR